MERQPQEAVRPSPFLVQKPVSHSANSTLSDRLPEPCSKSSTVERDLNPSSVEEIWRISLSPSRDTHTDLDVYAHVCLCARRCLRSRLAHAAVRARAQLWLCCVRVSGKDHRSAQRAQRDHQNHLVRPSRFPEHGVYGDPLNPDARFSFGTHALKGPLA